MQVAKSEMSKSKGEDEHENSRYSIAQHQVTMPLTDYYEKKMGGSAATLHSNFGQRFIVEQEERRSPFYN